MRAGREKTKWIEEDKKRDKMDSRDPVRGRR
jgi:hypothetical protein